MPAPILNTVDENRLFFSEAALLSRPFLDSVHPEDLTEQRAAEEMQQGLLSSPGPGHGATARLALPAPESP